MICRKCQTDKPIESFSWKVKNQELRQSLCKDCAAAYERWYRQSNRERTVSQNHRYYSKGREKILAQKRAYYRRNLDIVKARNKAYYDSIKDTPEFKRHTRAYALKSKFGITLEQYEELLKAQNGVCAICRNNTAKTFAVDHCHSTGKIRGLLCPSCNSFLGRIADDPSHLISYLSQK